MLREHERDPNFDEEYPRLPRVNFRIRNDLLYYVPGDRRDYLYNLDILAGEIIGEAYNRYY